MGWFKRESQRIEPAKKAILAGLVPNPEAKRCVEFTDLDGPDCKHLVPANYPWCSHMLCVEKMGTCSPPNNSGCVFYEPAFGRE